MIRGVLLGLLTYGSIVYTDNKKTVLFTPPTAGFMQLMQLLKGN